VNQSLLYHAFGVRKGYDYVWTLYEKGCIRFVLVVRPEMLVCPRCKGLDVSRKGRRFRELRTVPIGLKPVWLFTEVPQCQCRSCGQNFQVSPPFAPAYASHTRQLQALIQSLRGMMTVTDLAAVSGLGWDTVKSIIKVRLEKDYGHPRLRGAGALVD